MSTITTLLSQARQAGIQIPDGINAAVEQHAATIAKCNDLGSRTAAAEAIAEALATGADLGTAKLRAALTAYQLGDAQTQRMIYSAADRRLEAAVVERAEEFWGATSAAYAQHAAVLTAAAEILGDTALTDHSTIVARGGSAAQAAINARESLPKVSSIVACAKLLAELTNRPLIAGAHALGAFTGEQWLDLYARRHGTDAWDIARLGIPLRLGTRADQEAIERESQRIADERHFNLRNAGRAKHGSFGVLAADKARIY